MADAPDVPIADDDNIPDVSLTEALPDKTEPTAESQPSKPDEKPTQATDAQDKPTEKADEKEPDAADTQAADDQEKKADEAEPADDKAERQRRAQQEYQNRQRVRQQVAQQLDQFYGPKTAEQLVEEGLSQQDAQIQALREEMAYKEQRAQIAELNASMQAEAVNVFHDYPVFDPNSKDFDQEFTQQVEQAYKTAARFQVDDHGNIVNAEVPIYQFYQQMADIYSRGATKGNQQGQEAVLQTIARTDDVGGSTPTRGSGEKTLQELEDELGDVVLT